MKVIKYVIFFLAIVILGFVLKSYIFFPYTKFGASMEPTIKSGQKLNIKRFLPGEEVKRGEIILYRRQKNVEFVSRLIAIPKDRIKIFSGKVFLNGNLLDEPYLTPGITTRLFEGGFILENKDYIVPDNSYFILGDNRPYSLDSREFGFIKGDAIIGKIVD